MKSERDQMIQAISARLGKRSLYWMGIRGDDARSLADIPQFSGSFSIINQYSYQPLLYAEAYEDIDEFHFRVDLDEWDIDNYLKSEPTKVFRHLMFTAVGRDASAITAYRPSLFLSAITFSRQDRCLYLGMYVGQQHVFEHKPWVEMGVRSVDVPSVEWRYIADEDQLETLALLSQGPVVVRPSRGSGGVGMARVDAVRSLQSLWPSGDEFFASVSTYMDNCIPLNIGAVVWDDGVTMHHLSVQLIGLPCSTKRQFGYCGNDFGLVSELDPSTISQVEQHTVRIGNWLKTQGYRGAFGVDYLVNQGKVLFTELNPRFQGSTRVSARLDALDDQPCLLLEHIAALLHITAPKCRSLVDLAKNTPPISQVIVHNLHDIAVRTDSGDLLPSNIGNDAHVEIAAFPSVDIAPNAVIAILRFDRSVTQTGYDINPTIAAMLNHVNTVVKGV